MSRLAGLFAKVRRSLAGVFWRAVQPGRDLDQPHYLKERYGIEEKPEGWNDAVLHHFHEGPELREPTPEFRGAFFERASQDAEERTIAERKRLRAARGLAERPAFK